MSGRQVRRQVRRNTTRDNTHHDTRTRSQSHSNTRNSRVNDVSQQTIVVIGGGCTGIIACYRLMYNLKSSNPRLILIDKKDYYENPLGAYRASVDNEVSAAYFTDFLNKKVEFIQGEVTALDRNELVYVPTERHTTETVVLEFDYACVCTGSAYPFPYYPQTITLNDRENAISRDHDRLKRCRHVVLGGGGVVAIETAGEIVAKFPDIQVTIVAPKDQLALGGLHPVAVGRVNELMRKLNNLTIILNKRITDANDSRVILDDGSIIKCDRYYQCWRSGYNTKLMEPRLSQYLHESGRVIINNFYQIGGIKNLFCCGDAANGLGPRCVANGEQEAHACALNLAEVANGGEPKYGFVDTYPYEYAFNICTKPDYAVFWMPITNEVTEGSEVARLKINHMDDLPTDKNGFMSLGLNVYMKHRVSFPLAVDDDEAINQVMMDRERAMTE